MKEKVNLMQKWLRTLKICFCHCHCHIFTIVKFVILVHLCPNLRLDPSLCPVYIEVGISIVYVEESTEAVSWTPNRKILHKK